MKKIIPSQAIQNTTRSFEIAARQSLRPPPRLSLPEWADKYRRLSRSSGAIGGPWRTSRVEIARGPMMAVKERGVKTISCMVATQTLKTELLLNIIGYHAHLDPSPMILALPKDGAVKSFSKERLSPMVRATPVLKTLFDGRTRNSADTIDFKEYPGGFLALVSAGSPTNLSMRPVRITLADEVDKYEDTKEGDPLLLLEERSATFTNRALHLRCCSPTWEEKSRILDSFNASDMRRPFVACPHCGYEQTLDFFAHVHWSKSDDGEHFPMTAAIFCEKCGAEWSEAHRLLLMTTEHAIRWRQTREFVCCGVRQEPMKTRRWSKWNQQSQIGYALCEHCNGRGVSNAHAGFHASKLYSPFITVPELAAAWLLAKDSPESKQTFYNTQLGLPFHAQALKKIETNTLAQRRETFKAPVPVGVLVLTAGIDVQAGSAASQGRLEIEVVGWGIGEESWSIAHKAFLGDPAKPEVWKELDDFLLQGFDYEGGGRMAINGACIDSGGHNTEEVYKFARARINRNIWAVKGAADRGGQWSPVWPVPKFDPKKTRVTGYKPIMLGVNSAKEAIRQRLLIEDQGPGFAHFPAERPEAWFDQLTSEQLIIEKKAGIATRRWVLPRGRANEALDCRVYAYGALCGLYATRKLNLEKRKLLIEASMVQAMPADGAPQTVAPPPVVVSARVRRSRWMA